MNGKGKKRAGELARDAVELLVRSSPGLAQAELSIGAEGLYSAAVRIIMRLVTVMFAEERRLLPIDNRYYASSYSLGALSCRLADKAVRAPGALAAHYTAWPALCSLFRLIHGGSAHAALPSRAYGGELFRAGDPESVDESEQALVLFERPDCCPDDFAVAGILGALEAAAESGPEGRFSGTHFIGSLYEALLDYSLKRAPEGEMLLVLNSSRRPVVPLSLLEGLPDDKLARLLPRRPAGGTGEKKAGKASAPDGNQTGPAPADPSARAREWACRAGHRLGIAGRLFVDLVLPGEFYLVRHDGTRKSGGVFYTPAALTEPTARRVLEPLCRKPGGMVRKPESILRLKVCDPAMGSGSFLIAALGYLTRAVLDALNTHELLTPLERGGGKEGATLVTLAPGVEFDLPGRPGEREFEGLLAAHVKRHVVENCIYGVDLDPLTVDLARLSLWLETMDHRLPFTFLDHKLKCGNSLIGCRYEDLPVYPAAAWRREGGDQAHREGKHFPPGRRTDLLKEKARRSASEMAMVVNEARSPLLPFVKDRHRIDSFQRRLGKLMRDIHRLPVQLPDRKRELYSREFLASPAVREMRARLDKWCGLWFWPAEEAKNAPGPLDYYRQRGKPGDAGEAVLPASRFFHWQLEFPDAFEDHRAGFDAVLANPPWDVAKPGAGEFFPRHDPLYGVYRAGEAEAARRRLFENSPGAEKEWLDYNEQFRARSNWFLNSHQPAGRFENALRGLIASGREQRPRPFCRQGAADINMYKLFTEMAHALCREKGRLGLVLPSGFYSDRGTSALRELLVDECRLEWLVGFENKTGVFDIHRSFKFCVLVAEKGGATQAPNAAFMVRDPAVWERAEEVAFPYPIAAARAVSPEFGGFAEVGSRRHLEVLTLLLERGVRLFPPAGGWNARYVREFDSGNSTGALKPVEWGEKRGFMPDETGLWRKGREVAYAVCHGAMVGQFDPFKQPRPRFLMAEDRYAASAKAVPGPKVAVRRITRNTDARTAIAALVPDTPCSDNAAVLQVASPVEALALVGSLNSFCVDFAARTICSGTHLDRHHLARIPLPSLAAPGLGDALPLASLRLNCAHPAFAPLWMEMLERFPHLGEKPWQQWWAVSPHERLRLRCMADAIVAAAFGLAGVDFRRILNGCEHPSGKLASPSFAATLGPTGFWRVDKDREPELRHTVLAREALDSLAEWGVGRAAEWNWQLPETLPLHGRELPVRSRLGPQFLPNQLEVDVAAGWEECRRHADRVVRAGARLEALRRAARGVPPPALLEIAESSR